MINEEMTPMQVLQVISGLCKTHAKVDRWKNTTFDPINEFNFIANMIDSYVEEQDKGSEGANQ